MKKVWISGLVACAALCFTAGLSAQEYTLGFSGPDSFSGAAGSTVGADYTCDLAHSGDGVGAQGWSLGIVADGGTITSITTDGTKTEEVYDSGFNKTRLATGDIAGAVSAVVLCFGCPNVIPPNEQHPILAIGVEFDIPAGGGTATLSYQEGLVGEGQPVDLVVTENGISAPFVQEEKTIALSESMDCCSAAFLSGFNLGRAEPLITDDDDDACTGSATLVASGPTRVYAAAKSNTDGAGIQGWSFGVECRGDISIDDISDVGSAAAPVADGGLYDSGFNKTRLSPPENNDDGRRGAVSAVVLCFGCDNALEPVGTEAMIGMDISGTGTGELQFASGLIGEGQPVDNVLTVLGTSVPVCNWDENGSGPTLTIEFREPEGVGPMVRGDANDDGKVNIADPIWIINELFRQGPATGCEASADANADDAVDLGDAMYIINYRFLAGPAPSAPFPDCGSLEVGATSLSCDTPHSNCL